MAPRRPARTAGPSVVTCALRPRVHDASWRTGPPTRPASSRRPTTARCPRSSACRWSASSRPGELPCVVATVLASSWASTWGRSTSCCRWPPRRRWRAACSASGARTTRWAAGRTGFVYPRTRTEVIDAAVVAEGMRAGAIEATALVRNAAGRAGAADGGRRGHGRRLPPTAGTPRCAGRRRYAELPRRAFDGVLDMLSGRYASADLAEFAPRIVWDREQRRALAAPRPPSGLAVTAAGTIPDRGMFSVVLPEGDGNERPSPRGRAGRGDGVRVARGRHHRAGHQLVAHQRDHARPRHRGTRAGPLCAFAVLAR